ncbi:putative leucine-rich repeat-containing protein DDB_G0290503 isoform X3 [Palaemon carinicauda]|uniref:putative leucine-rich repeat-containing protein DDB_G0290503 isoform X3 n=1 Tax=Palaemon carinicauda TaxID=392227 RepID=UPI0035B661C6
MEPEKNKGNGKESEIDEVIVMVEVAGADGDEDDDDDDDAMGQRRKMKKNGGHHHQKSIITDPGSDLKRDNSTSSSQMLDLLDEFTKIYSDRLQRVEQTAMKTSDTQYLESKVCVLESWVRDLGEQNAILVATVEELEKEAADRVTLLEDRLAKMAATTRESCVSLRDHQLQVSSLVAGKMELEKEAHGLGEKLVSFERSNMRLKEENNNLQGDLNNLVQLITRARVTGQWEADDLTFTCVTPEQVFGPVLSSSRRSSQSLKDSQRDYIHQMLEDHIKKDNSSIRSSLSNIHDADSSIYGSRGSEKDVLIMKLKADLRCSQTAHEEINCQLVERDKQIADLQAHLTEIHHELAESQAEVSRFNHTIQELRHQNKHESIEVTRKEEVLRHILCKASKKDSHKGSISSLCEMGDNNVEVQLSENIDILASRLAELEDECQQLRNEHSTLQDTHSLCAPTINMLQDQLSRSQQMQVELRTVLTSEVAERHDQIVALKDQVKEQEQSHHETKMQLQLRNEVIKDLRREIKELRETVSSLSPKVDSFDKGAMNERSASSPSNGYYSNSQLESQVSKLQNELAEKSILLRELQSHLSASRQEVKLKDETLYKLEQKLNNTRREDGQKGERMQYLTGQLTSLQLEVGRTHGQAEHLRRQLENKNEMLQKMEGENSSLTKILNEKSLTLEKYQSDILRVSSDLDRKKKEVVDQRLTINTLQDALVASKRTCDDLRMRLDSDGFELCADIYKLQEEVGSRETETQRLEQDLKTAQNLHHQTFTQLVESDARGEVLREENRALSRRIAALQEDIDPRQMQTRSREFSIAYGDSERSNREKDKLRRQLQEAERRCQEMGSSMQLLQEQVRTLEDEVSAATEARADAERRAAEAQRKNLNLQESLSAQETSESVERLGHQLEDAVAALTKAREEALSKTEQLRQVKQDVNQLSDALAYEKELNTNLHEQMESLMKVAGNHEYKTAEQQQELRKMIRDSMQKDRQILTLEAQIEGLKSQISALEDLMSGERKEVASLKEALSKESKLLQQTRNKLDAVRKEAAHGEEQLTGLRRDLQHAQDKISRQEQRIKEMESEREAEVAAVAERLTAAHEASVRRLEESLVTYSRLQAREEFQVENLEESLRDVGGRLAESELRVKELEREREILNRSLRQEQLRRDDDGQEYQRQLRRITEEMNLLKARLEAVQEETQTWQRHCEDLEERHQHPDGSSDIHSQLQKVQCQMDSLREALLTAKLETRKAEEERSHAHEQVLSLIRECNTLEEQIHRLTKEKCRLQEQLSCKESDLVLLERDNANAFSKEELTHSAERIAQLERELTLAKNGACNSEGNHERNEMKYLRQQLEEAQSENQRLKESRYLDFGTKDTRLSDKITSLQEEITLITRQLKDTEHREALLKDQIYVQNLSSCGNTGEIMVSQLRSEIASARKESSEARRMLLERESQSRMSQLKIETLQKMLQDRQQEVTGLEEKLSESLSDAHRFETEIAHLRARVATLTTQLEHVQSHNKTSNNSQTLTHSEKVESLEHEVSSLKGELAAKTEELNQLLEKDKRNASKVRDLEQDITRISKTRDEAHLKVVSLEGSLAESIESSEATKSLEKMWESQLANIQQEVSRLLCETTQLKDCNLALHNQLSSSQREGDHLRSEIQSKASQIEELQNARDLLANDAQVVVAAVKQWLHEQKTANSKLAGKLHQQNKHILHLNTEKQFLAERNTSLQKINHEISMQLHDLRARLGLPLITSPEKLNSKTTGLLSPRLLSPLGGFGVGGSSRVVSTSPPLDTVLGPSSDNNVFGYSVFNDKFEDGFSTCSSEGSSGGGCHVPGPDLPGALQLERLAHLADSLLLASRNITRNSNISQSRPCSKMTCATSLGDLTSQNDFNSPGLRSSLRNTKRNSSSVGNLSLLSPMDFKDKPCSPGNKFSYRFGDTANTLSFGSKANSKGSDFILAPPVRERKLSLRLFNTHSIEEGEEEDGSSTLRSDNEQNTPKQSHSLPTNEEFHSLPSNIDSEDGSRAAQSPSSVKSLEISRRASFGESSA